MPHAHPNALRVRLGSAFGQLEERLVPAAPVAALAAPLAAGVASTELVAFDVSATGSLSFNLNTGGYSAKVQLPNGASFDTSALKTLLAGGFAVPKVDPVKAVAAFAGFKTSVSTNHEQVRAGLAAQYGGGNVYLSTQRFSDWASPENVANTLGAGVLSGGATTAQAIQEAKDVVLGELGNLYTWLKAKAPAEAEAAVAAILKGVLTKQSIDTPYVAVRFQTVTQTYTVGVGGTAATVAGWLGARPPAKTVSVPHAAFSVVWKGPGTSQASLANALARFPGATLAGKADFGSLVGRLAARPELRGLGRVADAVLASNPAAAVDQLVATRLTAALGLTPAQLTQLYKPGNPLVDLRATALDENLAALLGKLKVGNDGSVKVTKLTFNLNTYEVEAELTVRARHTWGSLADLAKYLRAEAGKSFAEVARVLRTELGAGLGQVVRILRTDLKAGLGDVAAAVRTAFGTTYTDIARLLRAELGAGFTDIASALRAAGATRLTDLAVALRSGATATLKEVAYALSKGAGANLAAVAGALWDMGGNTRATVASTLWNSGIGGFYLKDLAYAISKGTGGTLVNVAAALWDMGGNGRGAIAAALWKAGIGGFYLKDVAYAISKGTGGGLTSVAGALWDMGGNTRGSIGYALWNSGIGGFYLKDVAYALSKGTGGGLTSVAGALWDMGGNTRSAVASALWNSGIGGFTRADVVYALWHGIGGTTRANIATALWAGIGGNLTDVAGALWNGGIGGTLADVAGAIWNGVSGITAGNVAYALWHGIGGLSVGNIVAALQGGLGLSYLSALNIARSL